MWKELYKGNERDHCGSGNGPISTMVVGHGPKHDRIIESTHTHEYKQNWGDVSVVWLRCETIAF
jgi:hypothetical protein